eukprot:GEZU01019326.1.p1 GENE.GEZU01019326.1~~GEZU01019326.1.p1  ORF type:complete len:387 (-),score=153.93 GEZU01019326.1:222-1382(-)
MANKRRAESQAVDASSAATTKKSRSTQDDGSSTTSNSKDEGVLKGVKLLLSGRLSKTAAQFESLARKHSGSVEANPPSNKDSAAGYYLIVKDANACKWDATKIVQAVKVGIPVVKEQWVHDSIEKKELLDYKTYELKNPNNNNKKKEDEEEVKKTTEPTTKTTTTTAATAKKTENTNNNNGNNDSNNKNTDAKKAEEEEDNDNEGAQQSSQSGWETKPKSKDSDNLETVFNKHKEIGIEEGGDEDEDAIQGSGLLSFADDLGVQPDDLVMMIILWKLNSKVQYTLYRNEFVGGFTKMGINNMGQIRAKLDSFRREIQHKNSFKQFYNFMYNYIKEPSSKSLPAQSASEAWKLLLEGRFKYIDDWCQFVLVSKPLFTTTTSILFNNP